MSVAIVVPTIGRPSLATLLASLATARGPRPVSIVLVDDRRDARAPLVTNIDDRDLRARVRVLRSFGRGPAAARNVGWRAANATWIAFLDDDVIVTRDWLADLARDLAAAANDVAGVQGIVQVPLPVDRRPTDWERNVASLATAQWITADCAYRRADLVAVGGFDERFRHAYREDADLGLRVTARGRRIVRGLRTIVHPVRHAPWHVSVALQRGNADDVLMQAVHGDGWRDRAAAPLGALPSHVASVVAGAVALGGTAAWIALTATFAWKRIAPGPRTPREVATMLATSAVIPFAAVAHRVRGTLTLRRQCGDVRRAPRAQALAVLFDRDGTLAVDVPYNGDPARVMPMPGARHALERLRDAGIATAVITNQSGVADGRLSLEDVRAVNARLEALVGPLGPVFICPHAAEERCACRKPSPALVLAAARQLGVAPHDCVVVGDIGSDMAAARNAGARAVLVPTAVTRPEEIAAAPCVAATLAQAVELVLAGTV